MIVFSQNIEIALQQPTIEAFYLVDFAGEKTTNYYADITLSNGDIFEANGRLIEIDPPKLSTSVDRELYKISFADPEMDYGNLAEEAIVGRPVVVRLGFVNQTSRQPYTDVADTVIVYKGKVDSGSYNINSANIGEAVFSISCASPMADLDLVKTLLTSKDALKDIDPNDNSFSSIYEGSGQIQLKWGKG
jgi:hypothetical protein